MRRLAAILLLSACLAGCGSSGPGYADRMHAALAPNADAMLKTRLALGRAATVRQARVFLTRLQAVERRVERRVAAISPPQNAASDHARLVSAFRQLDAQIGRLEHGKSSGAKFVAAAQAISSSQAFVAIGKALDAIEHDGYALRLG
jgi:hypothetical protein